MRKKILSVLFVTLIISCGKDPSVKPDAVQDPFTSSGLTHIRILGKFNERLEFVGKIGDNFDSALDSLQRKYEPWFCGLVAEGHYSGEGYIISKEKMNVDFPYNPDLRISITNHNKIPFIIEGGTMSIQNETLSGSVSYESDMIKVGTNVTSIRPAGDVTISGGITSLKGKLVELAPRTVILKWEHSWKSTTKAYGVVNPCFGEC